MPDAKEREEAAKDRISVADAQGRTGDITSYAIAAQKVSSFGPFVTTPTGWNNASPAGLYLESDLDEQAA